MSAISWEDALNLGNAVGSKGNRVDFNDLFLRPKAPEGKGEESQYVVKILQRPHPYIVHWANKMGEDGKRVDAPFPDAAYSNRASRNCHKTIIKDSKGAMVLDKEADCPWCKAGFNPQLKYMFNIYDTETKTIKILDVTSKVVDEIGRAIKNVKQTEGIVIRPEDWDEPCPYFIISASRSSKKNSFGSGSVDYSVQPSRKDRAVDQEILDAIIAINPEAAENCEEKADYKRYLHSLEKWVSPTAVATAEDAERKNASRAQNEEEDDVKDLAPKQKEQPKASLKKETKAADPEDENFDDDAEW